MDEATANKILEDYLTGQATEGDFEQALDFLKNAARFDSGLTALFRDIHLPGGISHETAQELMPYYLEPLARTQIPQDERTRFVAHVSQCPSCAADFLELQGFEAALNPFPQPALVTVPVVVKANPWPDLVPFIQTVNRSSQILHYSISFNQPSGVAVHEAASTYEAAENEVGDLGEYKVLFEDALEDEGGAYQEAIVTAWRTSATTCDLQVEINDPVENGRQAGQTVILIYDEKRFTQKTDQSGETVFQGLEIAKLATIKVEIQLNF